jgi:antitoxin protein of toxin-antitoxin system
MGLGDKFKNLAKQAQDSVAEHKEQLQGAVEAVSVAADRKTKGKHSDKIARMGQKATDALDRLDDDDEAAGQAHPAGQAGAGPQAHPAGQEPAPSAGEDRLGQ